MLKFLEDLKKKQNKEDVINRRQAKKRVEARDRTIETETPSKVKKVELEISEKEVKEDENVGTYNLIKLICYFCCDFQRFSHTRFFLLL